MKIVSITTLAMSLVLSALVFTGCKKSEAGKQGPAGPQGPQGQGLSGTNSGNITGTVTGTMRDGTPFTESFNYTYYFGGASGTLDSTSFGGGCNFSLARSINDIFSSNYANLNVTTTSKSASTGTLSLYFGYEKALGNNKMFKFSANTYSATASGLSYNSSTGLFAGNFNGTLSASENNTGNPATFTGNFQATVIEQVYIKHQESINKKD